MKIWYKFLFLSVFVLAFTGCGKDDDIEEDVETTDGVPYHSLDMKTDDGKVTQLQKHKVGKGIPIVIMGDGFVDKDIRNGKYRHATNKALEAIFSVHPLKSLRDYFDVYEVTAVSYNDFKTYWYNTKDSTFNTAFSVGEGIDHPEEGCVVSGIAPGDGGKVVEYAMKAINGDRIDDATIVVIANDFASDGVSVLYSNTTEYMEIPTGYGITYVNLMEYWDESIEVGDYSKVFTNTLLHEFGHSFAKLADEYYNSLREGVNNPDTESLTRWQNIGYYRNVSLNSDVAKTPWADFAADSRYDFEKLGCYEGGYYQEKGVYRPSDNSIMNANSVGLVFCFNVASRVMIYKRCMKLAYGDSWTFNYEDFVKFDLEKAKAEHEELRNLYPQYAKSQRLGAPLVIVNKIAK